MATKVRNLVELVACEGGLSDAAVCDVSQNYGHHARHT